MVFLNCLIVWVLFDMKCFGEVFGVLIFDRLWGLNMFKIFNMLFEVVVFFVLCVLFCWFFLIELMWFMVMIGIIGLVFVGIFVWVDEEKIVIVFKILWCGCCKVWVEEVEKVGYIVYI